MSEDPDTHTVQAMALVNVSSICTTAACQHFSAQVLQSLAPNYTKINACENWDQLVCGGYRQDHLPSNQRNDNIFSKIRTDVNTALREIVSCKEPQFHFQDGEAAKAEKENWILVKTSYDSCMADLKAQQTAEQSIFGATASVPSLAKFFNKIFELNTTDPMSPSGDVLSNRKEWIRGIDELVEQALVRMSTRALNAFVSFGPAKSLLSPNQTILAIHPDFTLGMPPHLYDDKKSVKRYRRLIESFIKIVAPRNLRLRLNFNAKKIIWYEHRFALRLPALMDYTNIHKRKGVIQVPLRNLWKRFTFIPMRQLLETYPWPKGYEFTNNTMVEIVLPEALVEIDRFFTSDETNEKLAYMFWHTFLKTQDLWNYPFLKEWEKFQTEVGYRTPNVTNDVVCLKRVYGQFPDLVDSLYVQKHFSQAEKAAATDILRQVKRSYFGVLNSTTWMSPTAHKLTLSKAADIVELVGFKEADPNILDPISLRKYYDDPRYDLTNSSYIDWYFDLRKSRIKKEWEAFAKPPPAKPCHLGATSINAIYSPAENSIKLPAALMKSPLFDARLPSVANYAGLGSIAAHEFTHALDDSNRHFDEEGVIKKLGWEKSDEKNYRARAQCFKKLWDGKQAEPNSTKIDGGVVLGEAIADSYGADIAYKAWKASRGPHDEGLAGLEKFTADQLFWILRSMPFCAAKEDTLDKVSAKYDPHPPMNLRTWLPLKNSKEWHESFGCEMKEPACELFGT